MDQIPSPRALLLDLDGTLADSLCIMRSAYKEFMSELGQHADDNEFDQLNGPPLEEVVRRLKAAHSLSKDYQPLLLIYTDILDRLYSSVQPSRGASMLLQAARQHSCMVGVVTSNDRRRTESWLAKVNLHEKVDFIISGDEVRFGKPHPEPYKVGIQKARVAPCEIVVIEDSPQGAESSINAGLRTLALAYSEHDLWPLGVEPVSSLMQARQILWG